MTRRVSVVGSPLVLGQAAVAIAAVAVAGAALQTFVRLSRADVGFSTAGVTLVDISVPGWKYDSAASTRQLIERLLVSLRDTAGAQEVAAVSLRPFRFGEITEGLPVRRAGDALVTPDDATAASRVVVTPDYFAAIGQPILEGRAFTPLDGRDSERVVVVSRALARALWGDAPAVGQRLDTYSLSEKWRTRVVVGVSGDARYRGLERPSLEIYVPDTQAATPLSSLVIANRTPGGIDASVVRQTLRRVEPELAIERIQTTRDVVQTALSPTRLLTTLTSLLGATGLLLLALGTFGAASAALRAARSEIAIRQALGARPTQAVGAPLKQLGRALGAGMLTGLAVTPLALSGVEALGMRARGELLLPLIAGAAAVILAAAVACAPSLFKRCASPRQNCYAGIEVVVGSSSPIDRPSASGLLPFACRAYAGCVIRPRAPASRRSTRRRPQHRGCGVDDHDDDQPADVEQRQRRDDEGGDQHGQRAAEREAERRAQVIAVLADELQAADGHQERARAHHDRECRRRVHAEQADQDHARRVEPDAERHQRAEHEVAGKRQRQLGAR